MFKPHPATQHDNIKPCPFCGGKAHNLEIDRTPVGYGGVYWLLLKVECLACGAVTYWKLDPDILDETGISPVYSLAIERYNRRAGDRPSEAATSKDSRPFWARLARNQKKGEN